MYVNKKEGGCDLDILKEEYKKIETKFKLPSFDELNRNFEIEKISEIETDYLIREVRKFISVKLSNYMKNIEVLLSPNNAPMFIFSIVKMLTSKDREILKDAYQKLSKAELEIMELDLEFSEEKDAKFILSSFELWNEVKKELVRISETARKNWDVKLEVNNKGYFG
jgi:hypothetical protein